MRGCGYLVLVVGGLFGMGLGACPDEPTTVTFSFDRNYPAVTTDGGATIADSGEDGDGVAVDLSEGVDVVEIHDDFDVDQRLDAASEVADGDGDVGAVDGGDVAESIDAADTTTPVGESCAIGNRRGTCVHVDDCTGPAMMAVEGFCDGHPLVRCCITAEDRCSRNGVPGACFTTNDCTTTGFSPASGLCPGASDIQCCYPTDRTNACVAGDFPVPTPNLVEAPGADGCSAGMVRVGTFCIDRYEAALVRADDTAVVLSPFTRPATTTPIRAVSVRHAVPQGYIDGHSASRACVAAGKRLCTSDEWLRACRGPSNWTYPYGNTVEPGRCNGARRRHPAVEYFNSNEPFVWSSLTHPCISQLPDSVHLTGENTGCVTAEGVFDMMGNVHEWVDDPDGTFRGGFYVDTVINGSGCLYRTTAHTMGHWDYSTGFRCCADPL